MVELERELLTFPQSKHDEQVDSISQALAHKLSTYTLRIFSCQGCRRRVGTRIIDWTSWLKRACMLLIEVPARTSVVALAWPLGRALGGGTHRHWADAPRWRQLCPSPNTQQLSSATLSS